MFTINNTMTLPCPEGFQELNAEQRAQYRSLDGPPEYCLKDPDRQMVISAWFQKLPLIARMTLKDGEIVGNLEKTLSKAMAPNGYSLSEFAQRNVGGREGTCFRYTYTAEGIPMAGEACFVRDGSMLYNLYVYYRQAREEESLSVWESFLNTVRWTST